MREPLQIALRGAGVLALFAFLGTALVAVTYQGTKEQIAENERLALLKSLGQLVDPGQYENNLLEERITLKADPLLGTTEPSYAYLAKIAGKVHTVLFTPTTQEGYSGTINLLVGINQQGSLVGVRTLQHKETPGLGDLIDIQKSDWILSFNGRSLDNLSQKEWAVKKDGGVFDEFTGATITPRAMVRAVYKSLQYFEQNREQLLQPHAKMQRRKEKSE